MQLISPSLTIFPDVGEYIPDSNLSNVVFPEPLGPNNAILSPWLNVKLMSFKP